MFSSILDPFNFWLGLGLKRRSLLLNQHHKQQQQCRRHVVNHDDPRREGEVPHHGEEELQVRGLPQLVPRVPRGQQHLQHPQGLAGHL